jgi:hypothetical protein
VYRTAKKLAPKTRKWWGKKDESAEQGTSAKVQRNKRASSGPAGSAEIKKSKKKASTPSTSTATSSSTSSTSSAAVSPEYEETDMVMIIFKLHQYLKIGLCYVLV